MSIKKQWKSQVLPAVKKELNLKNDMAVPRIKMVKIQVGIGSMQKSTKDFSDIVENVAKISGQKPVITKAKKAISNFKLREGMPVGVVATLRGDRALDFVERLVTVALPRVRDFRGLNPRLLDGRGNLSIGFKEATVFPEINPDDLVNVHGLQVTVATTAKSNEEGMALFKALGFPFRKDTSAKSAN